jgi:predicted ArsR family transcriptional regulator
MKNTKENILNQVLLLRKATITQLSEKLGISEISVRHHLIKLEAEGLVSASEERHGVGRPRFVYCLTEKGFQIAPTNYFRLTDQALTTMKHFLGPETFLELLKQIGTDLAEAYTSSICSENPEQILEEVAENLTKDGFVFSWTKSGESLALTTHHCPVHHLGQKHSEVCAINHALLESLIQHPLKHETCILQGDPGCTYTYEVLDGK